jgi:hypothetical protein
MYVNRLNGIDLHFLCNQASRNDRRAFGIKHEHSAGFARVLNRLNCFWVIGEKLVLLDHFQPDYIQTADGY